MLVILELTTMAMREDMKRREGAIMMTGGMETMMTEDTMETGMGEEMEAERGQAAGAMPEDIK